jgi:hypothetical protein
MGFGKTVCALTAIDEMQRQQHLRGVIVIAPLRVCNLVWSREFKRWDFLSHMNVEVATGKRDEREAVLQREPDVLVINFENIPWLFERGVPEKYTGLVIDEITKLKGGGKQFKSLRYHLKQFDWRVALGGTIASEGLEHLFYQALCVDEGLALGGNKQKFLLQYFSPTDFNQYNWEPLPGALEEITEQIAQFTYTVDQAGYLASLPPLRLNEHLVTLPSKARSMYREMAKSMVIDGLDVEAVNAAVKSGKLEQIARGFVYDEVRAGHPLHAAKMNMAVKLADTGKPVVFVYQYTWELEQLRKLYPEGQELTDSAESSWNSGELGVLFVHPKSAGHGLNLQDGGAHLIFLGPVWSRDQRDQTIARLWRRGQTEEVVVDVIVAADTVETDVMLPRVEGKGEVAHLFAEHLLQVSRR